MAYLIWTWLSAHGCQPACAAALLGSAQTEVGKQLDPCTTGKYVGLFQWGYERKDALLKKYGKQWCKLENQLAFMSAEMRQRGVWEQLKITKSTLTAAMIVADFEGGVSNDKRYQLATAYYSQIKGLPKPKPAIQWVWVGAVK